MIQENLDEIIELGYKAIALLRHVNGQVLTEKKRETINFSIHHLRLGMKYAEDALKIER